MKPVKHTLVLAAAAAAVSTSTAAFSQAYPAKPIRTIVTFAGVGEALCRMVAQKMTENLGSPVILESQAAAGGAVGAEAVMKAAPDGYTVLATTPGTHVMRQFLTKQMTFDPIRDFTPITLAWETVAVIAVHPSLPVNSMRELIDYAKKFPGKISYGTSGIGTSHHMASEMLKLTAGVNMVHVPYKTGAQSFQDAIAGQIPVLYGVYAQVNSAVQAGKLKIIALQNDRRFPLARDVPPIKDIVAGFNGPPFWTSYYGPANLPPALVRRLNAEINKAAGAPEVKAKLDAAGFLVVGTTPEELSAINKADIERAGRLVKAAGIQPE
ncbi:MAG: hypothetical protein A3H35_13050 [Betaproteobacteria bacterium RIFCSPLOWO2_02_FULL_62_17]|nr:MAG: hypothetical protein A3H35_13050 [Betaproteobacteria bacterium RIFCSPLOWO2_02_FULL_62_17]